MHVAPTAASTLSQSARVPRWRGHAAVLVVALGLIGVQPGRAQVTSGPVSQDGGPLSEFSTNTRAGSGPVHERARTLSDGRKFSLSGAPVRGSTSGPLNSGSVSDASVGSVRGAGGTLRGQTVEEGATGTVKKDIDAPLHEFTAEPLNDFGLLQHELRHVRPLAQNADNEGPVPGDTASPGADDGSETAPLPDADAGP